MSIPKSAQVVIIGGGVMGASIAYHLAARGVKDILLLERDKFFGQGATGRCAGGVRYQFATEVNVRLSIASLPMLERFESEIGWPIDYVKCGYIFLLTNDVDVVAFRRNLAMQNRLGVGTMWLDGDDIRKRLPMMRLQDVLAGTFNPDDGIVDPNGVVMGYINAGQRLGVNALSEVEVTGIRLQKGKIASVATSKGDISTPLIVNAAGPWAGQVAEMAGVHIPLIPIRRQWFTTTALPEIPQDFPFVIDFAQSLYFHREGQGLLIGMSNPDETPGFDQTVDPQWELTNIEAAAERLPLLEKSGLASRLAGLYEVTPDAHPIYGETPIKGFYLCTGFSGHGFMHGPVSGEIMAEIILDGRSTTVNVSMLDLKRFDEGRLIQEYNVV
jgi:sarcosine oxidase subunit beta